MQIIIAEGMFSIDALKTGQANLLYVVVLNNQTS